MIASRFLTRLYDLRALCDTEHLEHCPVQVKQAGAQVCCLVALFFAEAVSAWRKALSARV